jgi:hypothetical protein
MKRNNNIDKEERLSQEQALKIIAQKLKTLGFKVDDLELNHAGSGLPQIVLSGKDSFEADFSSINLGEIKKDIETTGAKVINLERDGEKHSLVKITLSERIAY